MDLDKTPITDAIVAREPAFAGAKISQREQEVADYIQSLQDHARDQERELNRLRNPAPVDSEDAPVTNASLALDETCSMIAWLKETLKHDESDATIISMRRIEKTLREQILKESAAGYIPTDAEAIEAEQLSESSASPMDQSQGGKHE